MDAETTAAPAQSAPTTEPTTTPVVTAADSAVASNDVAAYREARRAERGTPERPAARKGDEPDPAAAATTATAAATPATPEARTVSKRQQVINDYEHTLAELRAENARLKGTPPPGGPPPPPPEAPSRATTQPAIDLRQPALEEASFYTQHPDASTADYVRYLNRYDREVERATHEMHAAQTAAQTAAHARAEKFRAQITAAGDPDAIIDRLDPALVALETRAYAQAQGKPVSAANDLADEILDSEVALQVLEHLTAHPEAKAKLLAAPNRRALLRDFSRLEAQFTPSPGSGTAPKTITDAPAPAVTLGSRSAQMGDPADSAVARGDVAGYREARRAQRAALLR
jgi:hypothetical protein